MTSAVLKKRMGLAVEMHREAGTTTYHIVGGGLGGREFGAGGGMGYIPIRRPSAYLGCRGTLLSDGTAVSGATARKGGDAHGDQGEVPSDAHWKEAWAEEHLCASAQAFLAQASAQEVQVS